MGRSTMVVSDLASARGINVAQYRCGAGPHDPPFEEQHHAYVIAVVERGTFSCRTEGQLATLAAGSLFVGRPGQDFTCFHEHGVGDDCLAFDVTEEVAAAMGAAGGVTRRAHLDALFTAPTRAPHARAHALAELARNGAFIGGAEAVETAAFLLFDHLGLGAPMTRASAHARHISWRDEQRVHTLARWYTESPAAPWTLTGVAAELGVSRFHLVRAFTAVLGTTPHHFLVQQRLGRAVRLLGTSDGAITDVAADVGFDDLSNFINAFRRAVGMSPGAYRRACRTQRNFHQAMPLLRAQSSRA